MDCFADRISKILKEKKITQAKIAEDLGIRRTNFSDWKKNGTIPAADIALKIARYLGVSLEYLITGTPEQSPQSADFPLDAWNKQSPEQKKAFATLLTAITQYHA